MEVEPLLEMGEFEGTKKIHLNMWGAIKIGDAYIYITGDFDGCVGIVWEGKTTFMNEEVGPNEDITGRIHRVSDALDDYQFMVTRWSEAEGLDIAISR